MKKMLYHQKFDTFIRTYDDDTPSVNAKCAWRHILVLTGAFALTFALIGCAGSPATVAPADELDAAIRETSDYLNTHLIVKLLNKYQLKYL
ncbi:MAG: hypothetical protein LBS97_00750 [Treponema sp.]|jgi:hypothetical protein|nr:hypothetical protein [Treponema sp.]